MAAFNAFSKFPEKKKEREKKKVQLFQVVVFTWLIIVENSKYRLSKKKNTVSTIKLYSRSSSNAKAHSYPFHSVIEKVVILNF